MLKVLVNANMKCSILFPQMNLLLCRFSRCQDIPLDGKKEQYVFLTIWAKITNLG